MTQRREDAKAKIMDKDLDAISNQVLGAAIEVHRELGPDLLEKVYRECLGYELREKGFEVATEMQLPVRYKKLIFDAAYRVDMVVNGCMIVEIKAVEILKAVHKAQLLSYLKLSDNKLGLLINFHVPQLKQGIKRVVNNL